MNKRDRMLDLIGQPGPWDFVPAAFFLHFDDAHHRGRAAVDRHLSFFRSTDMDFVKVQFEHRFPEHGSIREPGDWERIEPLGASSYADSVDVVRGLVAEAGDEALVLVTLYSPFMCATQISGRDTLVRHLNEDADAVRPGLEAVTESLRGFVTACIEAGADGFYASTQGGEAGLLTDDTVFEQVIKPTDLAIRCESPIGQLLR